MPNGKTEPADLRKALAAAPAAKAQWMDLTPIARRDFVMWIEGAKQAGTRAKRIAKACDMLAKGKRRPCCYSVVPLDLHNALGALPPAKAQWRALSPDAQRDFIAWIDEAPERDTRMARIEKACARIAAGKTRP